MIETSFIVKHYHLTTEANNIEDTNK